MLKIHLTPLTLKSMALNTISLELWKQPDIVSEIKHSYHDGFFYLLSNKRKWSKILEKVVEKSRNLSLPKILKQKLNEASEIIGLRIKAWLPNLSSLLPENNIPDYIHLISLNSDGRIDRKKTAASILKTLPNMDPYHRYCFASVNCLEKEVRSLWKTLPVKYKNIILGNKGGKIQGNSVSDIVIYWSCCVSQEFDVLYRRMERSERRSDNIIDYFIRDSIRQCNCVAFKYFWKKLSEEEKQQKTVKYAIELNMYIHSSVQVTSELLENLVGDSIEICHHLGSQMNEVQLKELVQQGPYEGIHFWFWCGYWHEGFISLDSLWGFISPNDYRVFLMEFVFHLILHSSKSEFFVRKDRRIFKELWENTPDSIKRGFFENVDQVEFILDSLIITVDVENLQLIFDDATDEERNEIINHSFSRQRFVSNLERYAFPGATKNEDFWVKRHLTEKQIDDFLNDIQSALNGKQVKGDLGLLLNKLNKWKTKSTS